jgi:hypothetical protein
MPRHNGTRGSVIAVLLALIVAGCGGDGDDATSPAQQGDRPSTATTTETDAAPERAPQETAPESRPSRRDSELQRELIRRLRQESLGGAAGWRAADVRRVQVRGTSVTIQSRLGPARREAAAALCLTARRLFLTGGQGQTAYDVVVAGRDGSTLAGC